MLFKGIKSIRTVPILLPILLVFLVLVTVPIYAEKINVRTEIKNLKSKNMTKKLSAIEKLGKAKDARAIAALRAQLKKEKNSHLKAYIVDSLAGSQDKNVVKDLIDIVKTETNTEVKYSAVYALGYTKDETAVPVLIDTFLNENEDLGVRFQAASSLTYYPSSEAIYQCFIKGIEDKNSKVRAQALTSLSLSFATTKEKEVVDILKQALQDEDELVRKIARERLELLGVKPE